MFISWNRQKVLQGEEVLSVHRWVKGHPLWPGQRWLLRLWGWLRWTRWRTTTRLHVTVCESPVSRLTCATVAPVAFHWDRHKSAAWIQSVECHWPKYSDGFKWRRKRALCVTCLSALPQYMCPQCPSFQSYIFHICQDRPRGGSHLLIIPLKGSQRRPDARLPSFLYTV